MRRDHRCSLFGGADLQAIHVRTLYKLQWYQWTFIECVYIRKHCNTTVYLVLDQAANITFFFKLLMVVQTSFLVLKCIVCTKYPVKLNSWLYYIATYIFMYCDFFLMSFWQTCLLLSHSPLPHPTKPIPVGLCVVVLGEGGIEKKRKKKSQSDVTQQRWRPSVPTRWNSVWCRSKWAEEVQRWTAFQPCCFCFVFFGFF